LVRSALPEARQVPWVFRSVRHRFLELPVVVA
jgi:hypothetical protein